MNPFLENLLSALEKTPPNLGDADSVLTLLYDAYTANKTAVLSDCRFCLVLQKTEEGNQTKRLEMTMVLTSSVSVCNTCCCASVRIPALPRP